MIERPSARLILLDPDDRLFLFNVHDPGVFDPANPHSDPFWVMIGGFVDPGEEFADAAVREAREETAIVVDGPVRWVWKRERRMSWRGKDVLHRERFFLGRTKRTEVDTSGLDERERSWTLGHRWWRAEEIAASKERFEPLDLAAQLQALLKDGPPSEPVTIR
ncbi:MAG TPA: NUDIX domain-containing protein [Reyranella sp.]|jgi:8-oxo-dGTP pyrophosphatase MutT (NUDIX family)|nr:NUDIX domain-containing protein [Reyranella sp.]